MLGNKGEGRSTRLSIVVFMIKGAIVGGETGIGTGIGTGMGERREVGRKSC